MFQRVALSTSLPKECTGLAVPGNCLLCAARAPAGQPLCADCAAALPANNHRLPALCRAAGGGKYRDVRRLPATHVAFRRRPGVVPLPTAGGPPDSEPCSTTDSFFARARARELARRTSPCQRDAVTDILVPVPRASRAAARPRL